MSVDVAKRYFELMDDPNAGTDAVLELFADDAVFRSPRRGIIRGKDDLETFYEANGEFFAGGAHEMREFHKDGDTVVCEGTLWGETAAGRSFEDVGLVDIMKFDDEGNIEQFRAYLDYAAILTDVYDEAPAYRGE